MNSTKTFKILDKCQEMRYMNKKSEKILAFILKYS